MRYRIGLILLIELVAFGARTATASIPPTSQPILDYLNQTIAWYRQQMSQVQLATEPADLAFAGPVRQQAREVLELAFAFARAEAALAPAEPSESTPARTSGGVDPAALSRLETTAAATVTKDESAVEGLQGKAAQASGSHRALLESQLAEAKSQLQLAKARHDAIASFTAFVNEAGDEPGGNGLLSRIDELQRSVPEVAGAKGAGPPPATAEATAAAVRPAAPTGLVALATDLFTVGHSKKELRDGVAQTTVLRALVDKMRGPLRDDMRSTLQRGEQLSGEAPSADLAVLAERKRDLDDVTAHFKDGSAALVPLGKQAIVLGSYVALLGDWRANIEARYDRDLRALAFHLGILALGIGVILAASELWRRATFRYVHDGRRRQQSLLIRRILVAVAIFLMVALSFVTELGSLATFAGFITAGLAVALQNVILSVVAYFFLIGKYGVRVGDRVQISGIDGDVIDVGLIRLHLMELQANGHPTGRVVAFSNAVLFQASSNFFKQLPGSNFTWHQVALTFSSGTDYRSTEQRLLKAVEAVYSQYRESIARQHEDVARNLSIEVHAPRPESQFRLSEGGLEMTIRYPVPLDSASAIDDQVTRALLDAVEATPRLALAGSATPTIRAVPESAAHGA
jgi:small-conductance mechanosensitive channel